MMSPYYADPVGGWPLRADTMPGAPEIHGMADPYVVATLRSAIGRKLVVDTVRGTVRGQLADVKPDHIVLQYNGATFFVRMQKIVWVMPE